jgi:hypothetical protein
MTGKTIFMHERGKWSDPGYHATIEIQGINEVFIGSSWPNPFKPSNPAIKLDKYAGAICQGEYVYQFLSNAHNGKVGFNLRTKYGIFNGQIPTINMNPNQYNQLFAINVDFHLGDKPAWRGSLACPTINPYCRSLFEHFLENEQGLFILKRDFEEVS